MWIPFTFGYISLHLSFIGIFTFSSSHVYFTGSLCLTDGYMVLFTRRRAVRQVSNCPKVFY